MIASYSLVVERLAHLVVGRSDGQEIGGLRLAPNGSRLAIQKHLALPNGYRITSHCNAALDKKSTQVDGPLLLVRHVKHHYVIALNGAKAGKAIRGQLNEVGVAPNA